MRLVRFVIASEAKQSISGRFTRVQPQEVDCRVASLLAMTKG
jgi:hypothetical protein